MRHVVGRSALPPERRVLGARATPFAGSACVDSRAASNPSSGAGRLKVHRILAEEASRETIARNLLKPMLARSRPFSPVAGCACPALPLNPREQRPIDGTQLYGSQRAPNVRYLKPVKLFLTDCCQWALATDFLLAWVRADASFSKLPRRTTAYERADMLIFLRSRAAARPRGCSQTSDYRCSSTNAAGHTLIAKSNTQFDLRQQRNRNMRRPFN
ncbi:hypothetical protein P171DRAFT_257014 [Karstenula rhodostoma CBS 690.94]|uniref:Uncharacterized protein n=1 Tax=Karstenula rhodostoma CBS 690.94 TaxID=1392251 RepID=A0A9P4PLP0_9PLEO|nr:hypothetical protein P171DRAFT_257014 [Karstenula rhodostoma CBS 690.94]